MAVEAGRSLCEGPKAVNLHNVDCLGMPRGQQQCAPAHSGEAQCKKIAGTSVAGFVAAGFRLALSPAAAARLLRVVSRPRSGLHHKTLAAQEPVLLLVETAKPWPPKLVP